MRQHGFRSVWAKRRRRSTRKAAASEPAVDLVGRRPHTSLGTLSPLEYQSRRFSIGRVSHDHELEELYL